MLKSNKDSNLGWNFLSARDSLRNNWQHQNLFLIGTFCFYWNIWGGFYEKKRARQILITLYTHFMYGILDSKRTTRFQFSIPGLREIHRNLKQRKNFKSRETFFRKSPYCTFSCINPGFGGPLEKLWILFLVAIFIMLQKNAFDKIFFWNSCTGLKVPFWQFFNFAKRALLNLCMNFNNFLA